MRKKYETLEQLQEVCEQTLIDLRVLAGNGNFIVDPQHNDIVSIAMFRVLIGVSKYLLSTDVQ